MSGGFVEGLEGIPDRVLSSDPTPGPSDREGAAQFLCNNGLEDRALCLIAKGHDDVSGHAGVAEGAQDVGEGIGSAERREDLVINAGRHPGPASPGQEERGGHRCRVHRAASISARMARAAEAGSAARRMGRPTTI